MTLGHLCFLRNVHDFSAVSVVVLFIVEIQFFCITSIWKKLFIQGAAIQYNSGPVKDGTAPAMLCRDWRSLKVLLRCGDSLWAVFSGPDTPWPLTGVKTSKTRPFSPHRPLITKKPAHGATGHWREQPLKENPKGKRRGNGVCVYLCICETERESEG